MAKQPKGFGQPARPTRKKNSAKLKSKPIALEPLLDIEFIVHKEARLQQLFGSEQAIPWVSQSSLKQYHQVLQETIEKDIALTIDEPLSWEDIFVYGPGAPQSHESLRQHQPSYLDQYYFVALHTDIEEDTGLQVTVQRGMDGQRFTLPLYLFRAVQTAPFAFSDYRFWWDHYRALFP